MQEACIKTAAWGRQESYPSEGIPSFLGST